MVATTDCSEKSKPITGHKVSKPLMEKKRRARINKCLDQLKTLLESYYSSNIRKRKLEKADILELTVKHLRNLQKIHSCTAAASEFPDYQTGFRSCLANVSQYLVTADTLSGGDRWVLSHLSRKLCRSLGREEVSSTMDSGPRDEARRLHAPAAAPEEGKTATCKAVNPHGASAPHPPPCEGARRSPASKQAGPAAAPSHSGEQSASHRKCRPVSHRDEVANTQHSVWRPW